MQDKIWKSNIIFSSPPGSIVCLARKSSFRSGFTAPECRSKPAPTSWRESSRISDTHQSIFLEFVWTKFTLHDIIIFEIPSNTKIFIKFFSGKKSCWIKKFWEKNKSRFPEEPDDEEPAPKEASALDEITKDKSKGKKSKVAAKDAGLRYQWQIMQALGLKDEEIKYRNPMIILKNKDSAI